MKSFIALIVFVTSFSTAHAFELTSRLKPGLTYDSGEPVSCRTFANYLLVENYVRLNAHDPYRQPSRGLSEVHQSGSVISVELGFAGGEGGGHAAASANVFAKFKIVKEDAQSCVLTVEDIW